MARPVRLIIIWITKLINIMRYNKIRMFLWFYFCITILLFLYCFLINDMLNKDEIKNNWKICRPILSPDIKLTNIENFKNIKNDCGHCICNKIQLKVTLESVDHLRRSHTTAQELFNYLSVTLNKTNILNKSTKDKILQEVSDIKNVIQLEIEKATKSLGIDEIKYLRLKQISEEIQSKITRLQNPPKGACDKVPKLVCKLRIDAGFASGIHEVLWCLLSAYYKNQTVILAPNWNRYFGRNLEFWERIFLPFFSRSRESWDKVFLPLSSICNYTELPSDQLQEIPRPNSVIARRLMNELPKGFGVDLIKLLDSPNSWFHAQFIGYIMRPQPRLQAHLDNFKRQINHKHPIVGIQIRRTDKLTYTEALYYPLSDYMFYVKDYFDKLELTGEVSERLVYVASDDPSVLKELVKEYPKYKFVGSASIAQVAEQQTTRYSNDSLWGVLTDIHMLSESDYIVCTFSSAICRLSYQLMRFKTLDASFKYRSLDVPFHYHHSLTPKRTALYNHSPKSSDQWNLKVGDSLYERIRGAHTEWFDQAINGRGWDTYFYASNSSSNQRFYKLYPYYKVFDNITLV